MYRIFPGASRIRRVTQTVREGGTQEGHSVEGAVLATVATRLPATQATASSVLAITLRWRGLVLVLRPPLCSTSTPNSPASDA
jgi:hypothetical protein